MLCPNCQNTNPPGAKFCFNCGTALAAPCSNCGTELAPNARFCFNCGQPVMQAGGSSPSPSPAQVSPVTSEDGPATTLESSPGRLEQYIPRELLSKLQAARSNRSMAGERRIVTVLFCDVKGSTALAETLDPEEWAEIMNGAFKQIIEPIYHYEGTLARLMGDAILAFFGAPITHEDDPQRAVLAGLDIIRGMGGYRAEIQRRYGFDLSVRVGINTGLVVVGEVGSDLRVEYTAMGDAVNLASRIEQSADPNTVRISARTHKAISNLFEFRQLDELDVKGKSEPVAAFEVIRALEGALPTRGIEGLSSPLVGRASELATLRTTVEDLAQGMGQVVSVIGEAGLGKSRLVAELKKSLGDDPSLKWLEGRSLSYETSTPYAPFINILMTLFELRSAGTDADRYARVCAAIEEAMPGQSEEIAPFVATVLGIELEGEARERVRYLEPPALRARVFYAIVRLFGALAARRPVLVLFEDLHWADSTSLELIQHLLTVTESAPLLVMAVFRPNTQDASWSFHELGSRDYSHRYTSVALQPLGESESRELVANLLEIEDLPEKVRALILRKAEGNPFFVEEVIRSLLDAKLVVRVDSHWQATHEIDNVAVPDTLAGVITARLDRLDEESKYVAQTAAVVGREFEYEVLSTVYDTPQALDGSLLTLQHRELIREKTRIPDTTYLFKHVLTQETAYASILRSRRRELHGRVAECLERTGPDRVNDIARHWLESGQDVKALPYLIEAADRAARAGGRDEAIVHYRRAVEIARVSNDNKLAKRAYEGLGKAFEFAMMPVEAIATYNEMLAYAEEHNEVPIQVSALNKLSFASAFMMGQMEQAEKLLQQAEELARSHDETAGLLEAITVRCGICAATGDFVNATRHLEEAARLGQEIDDQDTRAYGLAHKSQMLAQLTRFNEAYDTALEGLATADGAGNLERRAEIMTYALPFYHMHRGELDLAFKSAEEGFYIGSRIGTAHAPVVGCYVLGLISQMQGKYQLALQWHERGLQHARPLTPFLPFLTVMSLGGMGAVCMDISATLADTSVVYHKEALELLKTPVGSLGGGTGWADLGFCAMQLGAVEAAYEYFQNGLNFPSPQMYLQRSRMLAGSALAAQALGKEEEAQRSLEEAHRYGEERGLTYFYPLVALCDARISETHNKERALAQFRRAEKLGAEMNLLPTVWQARVGEARLLSESGQTTEAASLLQSAEAIAEGIAAMLTDPELREAYRQSARLQLDVRV